MKYTENEAATYNKIIQPTAIKAGLSFAQVSGRVG